MKTVKLGDIAVISAGNSAPQKKEYFYDGQFPFFRTSDVGLAHRSTNLLNPRDKLSHSGVKGLKLFKRGTILFPKSGASIYLNHRAIMGEDGYVVSHLATITANETLADSKYLYYFLTTVDARALVQDQDYPALRLTTLKDIDLPLPLIEEQRRVVERLDAAFEKIDRAIELTEKNLKKSQEIFDHSLQDIITSDHPTWDKKTLKDISREFGRGKSKHRPRNDKKLYNGEYPFIQTGDIRNSGHYIIKYTQTYNDFGLAQSKLWPKGTICITIAANIAETGILSFAACFPDSVIGLVVDESQADGDYVEYVLQSLKTRLQSLGKGSAQDNINLGTFENELFPFPNLSIQKEIVEKLNMLSNDTLALKNKYETKIAYLKALKQSLLTQAFSQSEVE